MDASQYGVFADLGSLSVTFAAANSKKLLSKKDFLLSARTAYGVYCSNVNRGGTAGPVGIRDNEYLFTRFISQLSEFTKMTAGGTSLSEGERKPLGVLYLLAERISGDLGIHAEMLTNRMYLKEVENTR